MTKVDKPYWYILHIPTGYIVSYKQHDLWRNIKEITSQSLGLSSATDGLFRLMVDSNVLFEPRKKEDICRFKTKVDAIDFLRDRLTCKETRKVVNNYLKHHEIAWGPKQMATRAEYVVVSSNDENAQVSK